jgi:magnesium chelatase subunit D
MAIAFPFSAVIGMDLAKQALLLLAVEPGLKGVLIAGGSGIGKTLLARGFGAFLADESRPFVEVPLGVTADRLSGSLDLERTLLTGKRHIAGGLLALAHGGVLYVEGTNLLDRGLLLHVAGALNTGAVHLERDKVSAEFPSEFLFVGSYDPNEGEIGAALFDSVGLHVREVGPLSHEHRVEILTRAAAFDRDPLAFAEQYAAEQALLTAQIAKARSLLPRIEITIDDRRRLSRTALQLGVEGHRADIFSIRLARAHAALMGHISVQERDLEAAVQLVLLPRAMVFPESRSTAEPQRKETFNGPTEPGDAHISDAHIEDLIIQAIDCGMPDGLLDPPMPKSLEQSRTGRRKGLERPAWDRGKYVHSVIRNPRSRRIAIEATLRAAALRQCGRTKGQTAAIHVIPSDLRFKEFRQKAGMLIILAVDVSGSMALNRLNQAKGALIRLLREAYLHRDRVALVSFRGDWAQVLLQPSRSVELAKRALDSLPAGGGTPLAAGLHAAHRLAQCARRSGVRQALLVLFTDGRPNVAMGQGAIWGELEEICADLQLEGVASVVIDTSHHSVSNGGAEKLAKLLGGRHVYMPRPTAEAVYNAVSTTSDRIRTTLGRKT